eukprot:356291-Pyramimonas_sp.AAC.1
MTQWQGAVGEQQGVRKVTIPRVSEDFRRWLREGREWCGAGCEGQRLPTFASCILRARARPKPKGVAQ